MPSDYRKQVPSVLLGIGYRICVCENPRCRRTFRTLTKHQRYCTKTCRMNFYNREAPAALAHRKPRKVGDVDRTCKCCDVVFQVPASSRRKRDYCTRKCRNRRDYRRKKLLQSMSTTQTNAALTMTIL